MLKQSDAVVIFVVLAAVAGIFILSSNTASLVVVAGLAAFFGGLIGNRLRKASASDQDEVAADNVADEQSGQATAQADTKFDNAPAAADVAASEQNASADQANGSTASTAATATARPKSFGDTTAPSQVALLKNLGPRSPRALRSKIRRGTIYPPTLHSPRCWVAVHRKLSAATMPACSDC